MTTLSNNLLQSFKADDSFVPSKKWIRTKIICTIGPKTATVPMLGSLVEAGMNVARLNFSHGNHEYHSGVIANLRQYLAISKRMCALMLDTKGPEIRTGKLEGGKEVTLADGDEITLTTDYSVIGNKDRISHSYPSMSNTVKEGSEILIDDGLISLTVISVKSDTEVLCRINNGGVLGETKGVNLPGGAVELPALTEKDKADLKFGCEQKVDLLAASFIRKASDVVDIRKFLADNGGESIKIISKIENQEGLRNFDEILEVSDGIMVARGDLGVEIPTQMVAKAQKMMISKCNVAGKAVVTATQMLDSMIKNPRPTRAETTDVANAVFDGSDCVMLSGETAKGSYPIETVQTMVGICREVEEMLDYRHVFQSLRQHLRQRDMSVTETITSSAVKTAYDINSSLIVCVTETGRTARMVCKYRPVSPVVCVTSSEGTARQLLIHRGAFPVVVGSMFGQESLITRSLAKCTQAGLCNKGDLVVVISGMTEGVAGGTNIMRVMTNK